mmetsp:Transcript_86863/g.246334  ORF Transcript_86863/g.246334 Transcript_86863/m.246334 type:complete len:176 (+) Transcript_86863:78-605(+)
MARASIEQGLACAAHDQKSTSIWDDNDRLSSTSTSLAGSSRPASSGSFGSADLEAAAPQLPLMHALALQRDISSAVDAPEFQDKLLDLLREDGQYPPAAKQLMAREELCFSALYDVLPKYGFAPTHAGMQEALQMLELVSAESDGLVEHLESIYDGLGLEPGTFDGQALPFLGEH